MSNILLKCSHCSKGLSILDTAVGRKVSCPDCSSQIIIPTPSIYFKCISCHDELCSSADYAGSKIECPSCDHELTIPRISSTDSFSEYKTDFPPDNEPDRTRNAEKKKNPHPTRLKFTVTASNLDGKQSTFIIEADSLENARFRIKARGLNVIKVSDVIDKENSSENLFSTILLSSPIVGLVVFFIYAFSVKQTEAILPAFLVILVICGLLFFSGYSALHQEEHEKAENRVKDLRRDLDALPDFSISQLVMNVDSTKGLAFDETRRKLCLIDFINDETKKGLAFDEEQCKLWLKGYINAKANLRVFKARDLVSSEVFIDGDTVTKTSRSSQLGGAMVGGALFGDTGAIIGGLSGKTISSQNVNRIDLRLTVADTNKPLHDITFLATSTGKNTPSFNEAIEKARHWHGIVEVLIKEANLAVSKEFTKPIQKDSSFSKADELRKLADLRDAGVLTEAEFFHEKAKVLET